MARFVTRYEPVRFVSMTSCQASSPMRRTSVSRVIPALATRTSTGPHAASMVSYAAMTCSGSVTSQRTGRKRSASPATASGESPAAPLAGPAGIPPVRDGDVVAVAEEPRRTGGADATGAAGDEDDREPGWSSVASVPAVTARPRERGPEQRLALLDRRSPATDSQRTTWPAKGVRTSATPTRPTRSPTPTASASPSPVPGKRPVPGAVSDASGAKMPDDGLTTTRWDM